jgi:hypothetical protein
MRRVLFALILVLGTLTAARCATMTPPIPLYGSSADFERLSGSWWGDYQSADGRHGTIAFALAAGASEAHGSVVMIGEGSPAPYRPYRPLGGDAIPAGSLSRVLTIRFASIDDGRIEGQLDPYWDPRLESMASTTFWGRFEIDTIDGTFSTTYSNRGADLEGQWRVRRHR